MSTISLTLILLERFSIDCRKTNTKVITATNLNRSKQRDEPIRITSKYLRLGQCAGKIRVARSRCDWFSFCYSLVEKDFGANQKAQQWQVHHCLQQSFFEICSRLKQHFENAHLCHEGYNEYSACFIYRTRIVFHSFALLVSVVQSRLDLTVSCLSFSDARSFEVFAGYCGLALHYSQVLSLIHI